MIETTALKLNYKLIYVKLKYQIGLPSSRNVGLRYSHYDYIGYLDDDCLPIRNDLIMRAYRWLSLKSEKIVGVGGPVYSRSNDFYTNIPNLNLKNILKITPIFNYILNMIETFYYKPRKLSKTKFLPGGNCFFNKKVLEKCNGFNPKYDGNYYREESDLCYRARKFGYLISDEKMPVNHLQVNYGGCRRRSDELYENIFSNTILLILENKRISLPVILDTFKHFISLMGLFVKGFDELFNPINRINLLKSIIKGLKQGVIKYFFPRVHFNKEIILETISN